VLGDGADHVQGDDRDPDRPELVGGVADVAAHDRAGEDEEAGPRQVGHRANRRGDVHLADERDRIDADPLATEVVAIGLADRTKGDLGDLGATTDDDDALAEDAAEGSRSADGLDVGKSVEGVEELVGGEPVDLDLELRLGGIGLERADRRDRPDPATAVGDTENDGGNRFGSVEDVEAGRGTSGVRGAGEVRWSRSGAR
jgi:hypothetical protein